MDAVTIATTRASLNGPASSANRVCLGSVSTALGY